MQNGQDREAKKIARKKAIEKDRRLINDISVEDWISKV
jgi:hypothetical protein